MTSSDQPQGSTPEAIHTMRCGQVTDTCYQSTSPDQPRPCPARQASKEGCHCTETDCAETCRFTTPRDPEARLIHYRGCNVYGYRSYPQLLCDDELHVSWVAHTSIQSANSIAALSPTVPPF